MMNEKENDKMGARKNVNIVIIGASGKTGQLAVQQALDAGHNVTAFMRTPEKLKLTHERLTVVQGDGTDSEAVNSAIKGQEAVISCVGSNSGLGKTTILREMAGTVAEAMARNGVDRIVYMASAGIDKEIPGMMGKMTMKLLGNVLEDHRHAVEVYKSYDFKWTIARPMGLTDKPHTGRYEETTEGIPSGSRSISRADVADFLVRAVSDNRYIFQSVGLASKE
ncbi:NAD(P)-dependent oxidoreductase [Gracilibacillus sp. Marseille-QA3620]